MLPDTRLGIEKALSYILAPTRTQKEFLSAVVQKFRIRVGQHRAETRIIRRMNEFNV